MTDRQQTDTTDRQQTDDHQRRAIPVIDRRKVLAVGSSIGTTLVAGCTGGLSPLGSDAGTFRLLVSDQPADIGDFDSLDVSFDRARVFRGDGQADGGDDDSGSDGTDGNETSGDTDGGSGDDGDGAGFQELDLGGATVDLTQVVGDKAMGVFEGELEVGTYSGVELYASSVEGIVDGEAVTVNVPSGKLRIVTPFEVQSGESVSFVFDINVVKQGAGGYNLTPVISQSGVRGDDVEVEEIDRGGSRRDDGQGGENAGDRSGDSTDN